VRSPEASSRARARDERVARGRRVNRLGRMWSNGARVSRVVSASGSAEPPSSAASEASGREGRKRLRTHLISCLPYRILLPSSHMPGSVDATSKLASVVRGRPASGPVLGDDDRERVRFPSPRWGRAREHRELNRRDNPRHGSGRRVAAPLRPAGHAVDAKRKPGRAHAWGRGAQCRFGKAPPSRSDRPPQGGRERVGRGSFTTTVPTTCVLNWVVRT